MQNYTRKTLRIYLEYSLKHKTSAALMLISITAASVVNVIIPIYFKTFFDLMASSQAAKTTVNSLIYLLLTIGGLEIVQWIFWRISTFGAIHFESKVMTELVNYCFAYLHKHSFSFFYDNFVGSLVKKVKWFGRSFETISDRLFWNLMPLVVNIGVIVFVLSIRNYILGLAIFLWIVTFLSVNWFFTKYKLKYDIKRSEAETETTGFIADTITNNATVKLFNGYGFEVSEFAKINDKLRRLRKFTWDLDAVFEAVQGFLMIFLEVGILFLALRLWGLGQLTVGDFVLIQTYLFNIFMRVWDFGKIVRNIYESLADANEMTEILSISHEIVDVAGATKLQVTAGKIEFRNVRFSYNESQDVLKDFNFIINPREHVALIGPSGAGKSTVVRLLLRMYDLVSGQVLIDGQDISHVTQESLWQNISLVPQDPILFHRSLLENIRYGRPGATDQEVMEAAIAANCHGFISRLPQGYNTYVGERGVKLSGGERQRVAIARAILRNSHILVLDEATSSLDSESETLIQAALKKLMENKTVLVIAHRLSTIRRMDKIVVVDQGGVVEQGSHEQLLKKTSSIYKRLWELQAGGFITE